MIKSKSNDTIESIHVQNLANIRETISLMVRSSIPVEVKDLSKESENI